MPRLRALHPEDFGEIHRSILVAIADFWREHHYGPGETDLASRLRTTRPIVRAAVKRLIDAGHIVRPTRIQHAMRVASPDEQRARLVARSRRILEGLPDAEREAMYQAARELFETDGELAVRSGGES
jgi:DNA-binding MarR family transcriptional regulator